MLPDTIDRYFVYDDFFAKNYLPSQDCVEIDKQLGDLAIDLEKITKMPVNKGWSSFEYQVNQQKMTRVKNQLLLLIKARENQSALLNCRNKFENIRQNETASLFEEKSIENEKRILSDSKKKQYLLIGIGATVLLTSLVLIIRKKK